MASFSIKESLAYSFKTYAQHFVLLLSASLFIGFASWASVVAPRILAQRLGVYQKIEVKYKAEATTTTSQSTGISKAMQRFASSAGKAFAAKGVKFIKNVPLVYVVLILAVWMALWFFTFLLHFGLIHMVLELRDQNHSTFETLFSGWALFPRYILGSFYFGLHALVSGIGFIVLGVALSSTYSYMIKELLGPNHFLLFFAVLFFIAAVFGFAGFLVRYIFYGFCIVDREVSALQALSCSRDVTQGSRVRLVVWIIIVNMLGGIIVNALSSAIGLSFSSGQIHFTVTSFVHALSAAVVAPLFILPHAYVYRKLAG